ncbi:MAG: DNA polymerase III subunit alpha [Candidatus Eisenbacteria bacterium]|nr:DNA polymerase III subunit alpha [Candidatus Eisenbacteria bacterium]
MPGKPGIVPLVARSSHSLLRGTAGVAALVQRAAALGHPALALTDRNNIYGLVAFRKAAAAAGIDPVHGVEVDDPITGARAVLLVRLMTGYENLCRLITRRMMDPEFRLATALATDPLDGLHLLTDDEPLIRALHPVTAPNRLWILLADPPRGTADWQRLAALGRELKRLLVASPDVMYLDDADREQHRLVTAIRERQLVARVTPESLAPPGSHLPDGRKILERFRDFPAALVHNRLIREECADLKWTLGKPIFPKCPLPPGETAYSHLFRLCLAGMRRRYDGLHPPAMRRLAEELEVIDRLGFVEYFIIVADICHFAHRQGIPTVGRGSGAGSIVTYLLGITNVCPLRYRLYFERFLHDKRRDLPDLDIDLCWRRRDDVINHVYRTYGADRVAMIATHNTFQARGAFRDAGRAHGLSPEAVDRMARRIPRAAHSETPAPNRPDTGVRADRAVGSTLASRIAIDRGLDPRDREEARLARLVTAANGLVGAPRHLGIHCGGIVIGDKPLTSYVPLEEATKGIVVTQFEMHAVEAVGLVKIDLLGNRAISVISESVRLIEESGGPTIVPADIPDGDGKAGELMARGDTLGVFQLESPGMRNLLRQLETRDLDGAIAALSLIRPGPAGSGMKDRFIRRARGLEQPEYPDPRLKPLLESTHGVLLYEEDVMAVGAALAGLGLAEGDLLRRAIAEIESEGEEGEVRHTWIVRAIRNGTRPAVAEAVWKELRRFGAYAFCKAHASGYGVLAYQGSWLKAHYPAAFAVAILNNHTAMYEQRVHLEDARRHGVPILPPCLNRSEREYKLEMADNGSSSIRIGLGRVRQLTEATIERTLAGRPFADLADWVRRVRPIFKEAEHLILAGGLDVTGRIRPQLLCELRLTWGAHLRAARVLSAQAVGLATGTDGGLFGTLPIDIPMPILSDFDDAERIRHEFQVLELITDRNAMTLFDTRPFLKSNDLPARRGRRVRMAGIVAAERRVRTKRGEWMFFLTLEDEDGLFECTLFPSVWRRYGALLRGIGPYVIEGKAEDQYGAVTVSVEKLTAWS